MFFIFDFPQIVTSTKLLNIWHAFPHIQHYLELRVATLKLGQNFLQLNTTDVTQVAFALIPRTLETQVSCLLAIGEKLFNENQPHIMLHLFYTQHCVWKTWRDRFQRRLNRRQKSCHLLGLIMIIIKILINQKKRITRKGNGSQFSTQKKTYIKTWE